MSAALDIQTRRQDRAPARLSMLSAPEGSEAFDAWLRTELGRMYDAALREPVPEELLGILRGETVSGNGD